MTIPFEKLKARLLADPKVKAEYDALAPEFEISAETGHGSLAGGAVPSRLAARMGTSQSASLRLESGHTLRAPKTLIRYAQATAISSTCGCRRLDAGSETAGEHEFHFTVRGEGALFYAYASADCAVIFRASKLCRQPSSTPQ